MMLPPEQEAKELMWIYKDIATVIRYSSSLSGREIKDHRV